MAKKYKDFSKEKKEKQKEQSRKWHKEHPEMLKIYQKRWRKKNPEEAKALQDRWLNKPGNREKLNEKNRERNALRFGGRTKLSREEIRDIVLGFDTQKTKTVTDICSCGLNHARKKVHVNFFESIQENQRDKEKISISMSKLFDVPVVVGNKNWWDSFKKIFRIP